MLVQLRRDIIAEVVAHVIHRAQQALDFQPRIEPFAYRLDRIDQAGKPFEREVLALHRDQHAMCGGQGIQGQQVQRGRTINQDRVVAITELVELFLEPMLTRQRVHQLDFGRGQIAAAGQQVESALGLDDGILNRRFLKQHIAAVRFCGALVDSSGHRRIALRIEIDQQHTTTRLGQRSGEIDGSSRLADSAFLVCNRNDACHELVRTASTRSLRRMMTRCRSASRPGTSSRCTDSTAKPGGNPSSSSCGNRPFSASHRPDGASR